MGRNIYREINQKDKVKTAWTISKKYTDILMDHEKNDEHLNMCFDLHYQFMHELKNKNIDISKKKNYIQCWDTLLNTLLKNPKLNVQRGALKLLHQTNTQRSYVV
tara:strand:+ start:19047 stop:19361 length:315 start_codon:yes stop_codon:yes gene_type:complete